MSSKFKPGIKTAATSLFSIYSTTDFCKRLCPDFRRNTISSPFRSRNDQFLHDNERAPCAKNQQWDKNIKTRNLFI